MNEIQKIYVLSTGGTIEKTYNELDGTLFNREVVVKNIIKEQIRLPYTHIVSRSILNKDSLEMTLEDRENICQSILKISKQGFPVVILHGTDTMQQTATLAHEKLTNLKAPVIFTGAMRPLGFYQSDAIQNITEALSLVKVLSPKVYISFHGQVFNLPNVRKNREKGTFEEF